MSQYSRRHYEDIASTLKVLKELASYCFDNDEDYRKIALVFADKFSNDNSRFQYDRFLRACGVETEE